MYEACIELTTRAGNVNMPELPRCDLQAFLFDRELNTSAPVQFDRTTVVRDGAKTCGSIQIMTTANLILWSSFAPNRFTLYIERASHKSASLQKTGQNSHSILG